MIPASNSKLNASQGGQSGLKPSTAPLGNSPIQPNLANSSTTPLKPGSNGNPPNNINGSSTTPTKPNNAGSTPGKPTPTKTINPNVNADPALGGECQRAPGCAGPGAFFNETCKKTPTTKGSAKIIPWDHDKKDFVYAAIKDEDFNGYSNRKELKRRLDIFKDSEFWDPVSCYNTFYGLFLLLFGLTIIGLIIYLIIYWDSAKSTWYLFLAIPIILLIVGLIILAALKNRSNRMTLQRKVSFDEELTTFCRGIPYKVRCGEHSCWLEMVSDPGNLANVQSEFKRVGDNKLSIASSNTKSSNVGRLNLMGEDNPNDSSKVNLNEVRLVENVNAANTSILSNNMPMSPMSQKKIDFQRRLESKKQGISTPPKLGTSQMSNFQSVKPEQEIMKPGKSYNLLLDDSALN
jgi:hypothetical protein